MTCSNFVTLCNRLEDSALKIVFLIFIDSMSTICGVLLPKNDIKCMHDLTNSVGLLRNYKTCRPSGSEALATSTRQQLATFFTVIGINIPFSNKLKIFLSYHRRETVIQQSNRPSTRALRDIDLQRYFEHYSLLNLFQCRAVCCC